MTTAQSVIDFVTGWRSQNQIGNGPLNATQLNQFVEELYQRLSTVEVAPSNKPGCARSSGARTARRRATCRASTRSTRATTGS
mgnify:CR=1 FL=1